MRARKRPRVQFMPSPAPATSPGDGEPPAAARPLPVRPPPVATTRRPPAGSVVARRRLRDSVGAYAYVFADLRRIGWIAGGLVVLLVALSRVLQ